MSKKRRRPAIKDKYTQDLERFIESYMLATGDHAWTTPKVASWAIENDLWEEREVSAIKRLARELSRVARQATIEDENGNYVRKYHAYRLGPTQPMLWSDMESIQPEQMKESRTMRRDQIVGRCVQLHLDLGYYNKHHNPGDPIIFDPDFTIDIEDRIQPGTYDDTPPEEEQEE